MTTDIYGTTHKVTGLKPKQDYEFRLRGITEKGPTDYVYSVPLHRRLGKQGIIRMKEKNLSKSTELQVLDYLEFV